MFRRTVLLVTAVGVSLALAAVAGAGVGRAKSASIVIRHQTAHCHAWSVNGGAFAAHHSLTVGRGATLTFTNDDVMPHTLVQLAGPTVSIQHADMGRPAAKAQVTFSAPGTYRFRTKAGEDYTKGIETTGEDNVLTLTVGVS